MQAAYLAGLFDGEGSINLAASRGRWQSWNLAVRITNSNLPVLSAISEQWGGTIVQLLPGRDRAINAKKPCYVLWFDQTEARRVLEDIQGYVIIKERQVRFALWYFSVPRTIPELRHKGLPSGIMMLRYGIRNAIRSENERGFERPA
jgi:hypothetical protein